METIKSYRVRRRLKFGEEHREWGELAPELHLYRRVDSLVHAGHVDYEDMDLEEFRAGVESYCPDQALRLQELLKVDLGAVEPEPTEQTPQFPRSELEAMELTALRELAAEAGLETKKKAEIIDALAEPEE